MVNKRRNLSWIIIAMFLISMVLPGFVQPAQAVDPISPVSVTLGGMTADGAVQVPVDAPLLITFAEQVSLPIGYEDYVSVQYSQDGLAYLDLTGISVSPVFDEITGEPTNVISVQTSFDNCNWGENLKYRVSLNSGAIIGLESGAYNKDITVNFQTVTTPEIMGSNMTTPQHEDTDVPLTTLITATYSEEVFTGPHFMMISVVANQSSDNPEPQQIGTSIDGNILIITPVMGLSPDTTYTVTIPAGAVKNKTENLQKNSLSFSFTTISAATGGGSSGGSGGGFNGTISGTVKSQETGDPIEGITVMALDENDFQNRFYGVTDASGAYTIEVPTTYQYYVIANPRDGNFPYANSFYPATGGGSIPLDYATLVSPGTSGVDFALAPGGSVSGTITDSSGNPLQNITVKCQQTDGDGWYDWDFTDSNGNYIVGGLPYGTYTIIAPSAIEKSYEDYSWLESQSTGIVINETTPNKTVAALALSPIDHPVVTDIWPKWIAAGTTDGWIYFDGAGFNTLGEGKSLKLLVGEQVIAQSTEMHISPDGRWLDARVQQVPDINLDPVPEGCTISLTGAEKPSEIVCNNWIGITAGAFIYGGVRPWAISGQGSAALRIPGDNLSQLGAETFAVQIVNSETGQTASGTAGVTVIANEGQFLDISFDNLNLDPGHYYIKTDAHTIHGMVQTDTETDLSAWVAVFDKPVLTGVSVQLADGNVTLLAEGFNFNQLDIDKTAAVITRQGVMPEPPLIQAVTMISDTRLQVTMPANLLPVGFNYDLELLANAGTADEEWLPGTFGFYLPINGQARFNVSGEIIINEINTNGNWSSGASQIPVTSGGYADPVNQLEAQIRGEFFANPITLQLSLVNDQLVLNIPAGLLRVGYYEVVLLDKQTRNEYDRKNIFVDNQIIPVIHNEHPWTFKTGITSFKVQFDGSTAIKDFTGYTVKLLKMSNTGIWETAATASEVNWDKERGRYLETIFTNTGNIGTGDYALLIQDGSGNQIECLNGSNLIEFTDQPFVYDRVEPWAVNGVDSFTIKIYGQNLTNLGAFDLTLYDYNNNPILSSAPVSLGNDDKGDFINAFFTPLSTTPIAEGWYTLKSNLKTEIDYMQDIHLCVSCEPKVTGADIKYNDSSASYQLEVYGINFNKIIANDGSAVKAQVYRNGAPLISEAQAQNITDTKVIIPLSMQQQLLNQLDGHYQVWLIEEQADHSLIWIVRPADFEITGHDPQWVMLNPSQFDPNYSATSINVSQRFQQAWKAGDTLSLQIVRMGTQQPVAGFTNLSPNPGTVSDTGFTFTLPAVSPTRLTQGIYWVEIVRNNIVIAKGRLQIGGPWIPDSQFNAGYPETQVTVQQVDSAFWQDDNNLTLYIMQSTPTGVVTPPNFSEPIYVGGTAVTSTELSFTLKAGLLPGDYFVAINRGSEHLTGAPFSVQNPVVSIPGDLNQDGKVDLTELATVALKYGMTSRDSGWTAAYDLNSDGVIDLFDLVTMSKNYIKSTP